MEVKRYTWLSYQQVARYIVGPLLIGTKVQRRAFALHGLIPTGAEILPMLGNVRVDELTTASIRTWHRTVTLQVSSYTAKVAKKFLRAALVLASEDFGLPMPSMPTRLGQGRPRSQKLILTLAQVRVLLAASIEDKERGIYYAFPFLTGVRPSEQLPLLWSDIDFDGNRIHIRRMQEPDGTISSFTKTLASTRQIPVAPVLRAMLVEWRSRCPNGRDDNARVFPCLGTRDSMHHLCRGRPLLYANFISTYWRPSLASLGLPPVTPHSARHTFISMLQAQGIEIGLVAKIVGHANISVTLDHYTQAVRGADIAAAALQQALAPGRRASADSITTADRATE
jgi:integrase